MITKNDAYHKNGRIPQCALNKEKISIENWRKRGKSPIILAIEENDVEVVKQLLNDEDRYEFKINRTITPLLYASKHGNLEIVKLLFKHNYHKIKRRLGNNRSPLYFAVVNCHIEIVKYLVANNAKENLTIHEYYCLIRKCISSNRLDILKCIVNSDEGIDEGNEEHLKIKALLHYSAINCSFGILRYLLECGIKREIYLNCQDTPLHCAVKEGHVEVVHYLLNRKVNSLVAMKNLHKENDRIIHTAIENGNEEILRILIAAGYSVENCFDSRYPIHVAAAIGNLKFIKILIEAGADINSVGKNDETPLHLAVAAGDLNIVKFLLDSGAHPMGNNLNSTPLHYTLMRENWIFRKHTDLKINSRVNVLRYLLNYIQEEDLERCLVAGVGFALRSETLPELMDVLLEYKVLTYCDIKLHFLYLDCKSFTALVDNVMHTDVLVRFLYLLFTFSARVEDIVKHRTFCKLIIARIVLMREILRDDNINWRKRLRTLTKYSLRTYYRECEEQLLNMQETKIIENLNITYYDILTKPVDKISTYVYNENLLKTFESSYMMYSTYASFLERHIEKGKELNDLIAISYNCLLYFVYQKHKIQLPNIVILKIFNYLSVIDFRKLIAAYY